MSLPSNLQLPPPQMKYELPRKEWNWLTIYLWKFIFNYLKVPLCYTSFLMVSKIRVPRLLDKINVSLIKGNSYVISIDFLGRHFTHLKIMLQVPFPTLQQDTHSLKMTRPPNRKNSFWIFFPHAEAHWVRKRKPKSTITLNFRKGDPEDVEHLLI
jgi:hypothetical protein